MSENRRSDSGQDDGVAKFRANFERSDKFIHLNNAGQSIMCIPAREEMIAWARRFSTEGAHVFPPLYERFIQARAEIGQFLGAHAHEVVITQSAAASISQIALGLELGSGDEIIVWDQEYPSNFYPWSVAAERAGAKLVIAPSGPNLETPIETIEKLISPRTRVIASSWVQYRTGAILDLERLSALARPRGIFTAIDIIQGAGCLPFDFHALGIDAASGGSHKWMCASHGPGYFLLREEHFEKITPIMVGAVTYGSPDDLAHVGAKMRGGPYRFEPGGLSFIDATALGAGAHLIRECGISQIAQEAEWLTRTLMHGIRERGYEVSNPHGSHFRGAIVNFVPGLHSKYKTVAETGAALAAAGVSIGKRAPGVRLSVHAHNTTDDIERVLALL